MTQKPFPVLHTRRLRLRAIEASEMKAFTDMSHYAGKAVHATGQSATLLRRLRQDFQEGNAIHWGVELKAEMRLIGTCGFYRGFADREGEVGYVLLPAYRGRGLMREAVRAVIDYGFQELGLYRIVAYTSDDHTASVRLLQDLGFDRVLDRPDGILAKFVFHNPYREKESEPADGGSENGI